ncbi:hypothetical protein E8F20_19235 [Pseudomonas sp. BN415]|uniref:hypothetical protein n=1 Tax=Pseudomonas sp. BN415 TaxID=2567889 RepID=UPI002457C3E1|nr:hypothetical protein [Pseudomonas sp. BN415]MDH4583996.1 hypothetical protein [Pseudomonas sp. BN415]
MQRLMHSGALPASSWIESDHLDGGLVIRDLQHCPHKLSTDGCTDIVRNDRVIPMILLEKCPDSGKLRQDWRLYIH